eukprot:jgi/Undpi1/6385/HiC_scaffold_20.g08866.m1
MAANLTELQQVVDALQVEVGLLRANISASIAETTTVSDRISSFGTDMDTLWLLLGSTLVVFMQAGFAMLEVGSTNAKHTKNILIKNLMDLVISAVAWWMLGHAIAFGKTESGTSFNQFVGGGGYFAKTEDFEDSSGNYGTDEGYNFAKFMFYWSFSGAAVTIASGALGERVALTGYFVFVIAMVGFIYPVVVRWSWNPQGWASPWSSDTSHLLFGCGAIDFAGSGVVHACGGMAALVMTVLIGPRLGRFSEGEPPKLVEHQSAIMQTLGTFILWMGWYGFNGCSTLYITGSAHIAAKAVVCTTLSAAASGLGVASASMIMFHHVGPREVCHGLFSGLVAITAGCAVVELEASFLIGSIAAINFVAFSRAVELVQIDDMVNASAVHLANGVWGVVAAGLFATKEGYGAAYYSERAEQCCGWLYGCGPAQLLANIALILAIIGWTGVLTFAVTHFLGFMGVLRISNSTEMKGTDCVAHGGVEVPDFERKILARIETLALKVSASDGADRAAVLSDEEREQTLSTDQREKSQSTQNQAAPLSRRADMFAVSAENFTAAGTADILLNEYIPLWGCPVTLLSDNGQQFTSKLATIVYDRVGIRKVNTSAYHPCTNGGVERVNHVLAQMLSMVGNEKQTDWDVLRPHVSAAYNNSVNAATGLAPNEIHIGRLPRLPLSVFEPEKIGGHQSLDRDHLVYINLAIDRQQRAYSLVRELHRLTVSRLQRRNAPIMAGGSADDAKL